MAWSSIPRDALIEEIEDYLDEEVSTSSHHTLARVVRRINGLLNTLLAPAYPLREERWYITGDGNTFEWVFPSPPFAVEAVLDDANIALPQIPYGDNLRAWLPHSIVSGPGALSWYLAPDNQLGIIPAPALSRMQTVFYRTAVPNLAAETVTVSADFTLADETVLGDFSGCAVDDGVLGPDGRVYRIASIDGTTGCEVSEPYRGASAAGYSADVGGHLGIDARWKAPLAMRVAAELMSIDEDDRRDAMRAQAEEAFSAIAGVARRSGAIRTPVIGGGSRLPFPRL